MQFKNILFLIVSLFLFIGCGNDSKSTDVIEYKKSDNSLTPDSSDKTTNIDINQLNNTNNDSNETNTTIATVIPIIEAFDIRIDENISINSVINTINIIKQGSSNITSFTLLNNIDSFAVENNGDVVTKKKYYNYDTQSYYNLKIYASNEEGNSEEVDVDIYINDLFEEARLLDTNVKGITYITNSKTGITDENGTLIYDIRDENIEFRIGGIILGNINISNINIDKDIFIPEILGLDRTNQSDENLVKILRLIQSLDNDENSSNGIDINSSSSSKFDNLDINISNLSIIDMENNLSVKGFTVVDEIEAINHFKLTLKNNNIISNISPTFTNIQNLSTVENNETFFYDFNATDLDGNDINYSIEGLDSGNFEINSSTGILKFIINPDFETKVNHSITVVANDGYGGVTRADLNITVINDDYSRGISHNGISYGFMVSSDSNKTWLDRNLGAEANCSTSTDTQCFGWLYQWGRGNDGHQLRNSTLQNGTAIDFDSNNSSFIYGISDWLNNTLDQNGSIRQSNYSKVNGESICPKEFRVPTIEELSNETYGVLNFPKAGIRNYAGGDLDRDYEGYILSNTIGKHLLVEFNKHSQIVKSDKTKADGLSVRCIED